MSVDLRVVIADAGGIAAVAKALNLSTRAIYKWYVNGLPRTEYTGETAYSTVISAMTHHKWSPEAIRHIGSKSNVVATQDSENVQVA